MNFVRCTLTADLAAGATTATVQAQDPFVVPPDAAGTLTIQDDLENPTAFEIVAYTGFSGGQITGITRGQESTSDQDWDAGAVISLDVTAAADLLDVPAFTATDDVLAVYPGDTGDFAVIRDSDQQQTLGLGLIGSYSDAFVTSDGGLVITSSTGVRKYDRNFTLVWSNTDGEGAIFFDDGDSVYVQSNVGDQVVALDLGDGSQAGTFTAPWGANFVFDAIQDSLGRIVAVTGTTLYVVNTEFDELVSESVSLGIYGTQVHNGLVEIPSVGYVIAGGEIYDYALGQVDDISDTWATLVPIGAVDSAELIVHDGTDLLRVDWAARTETWSQVGVGVSGYQAGFHDGVLYARNGAGDGELQRRALSDGAAEGAAFASNTGAVFVLPLPAVTGRQFVEDGSALGAPDAPSVGAQPQYRVLRAIEADAVGTVPAGKARIFLDVDTGNVRVKKDDQTLTNIATP